MLYRDYATVEALDAQYTTTRGVADPDGILARWAADSNAARQALQGHLGLRFGPHCDERLDLFVGGDAAPVHVFIHGGYWRRFHAEDFSFVARALAGAGVSVAVPNYSLCPTVRIDEIVRQVRAAVAWLYANVSGYGGDPRHITVSGHSAGGHLAAMLLATRWEDEYGLPADLIKGACTISGLFDLAPLRYTYLQPWLQLDAEQVQRSSPIAHLPEQGPPLLVSVGGLESDEFQRQSRAYLDAWRDRGLSGEWMGLEARNHFSALDALTETSHPLFESLLRMANGALGKR